MANRNMELESPLEIMRLFHRALNAGGDQAEQLIHDSDTGDSLQRFTLAFNSWAMALIYHADLEYKYLSAALANSSPPGRAEATPRAGGSAVFSEKETTAIVAMEGEMHGELVEMVERVLAVLNEEIGRTSLITRTKQHLHRQVLALRLAQEDHLETVEAVTLPILRGRLSEQQQMEMAKGLILDGEAQDPRWIIEWMAPRLDTAEQALLAGLEAHL